LVAAKKIFGTGPDRPRWWSDFPRAKSRQRGGYAMWVSLFTVVLAIALGFALGAVALESQDEAKPVRNFRR
jgi:hypothetical protein